MKPTRKEINEQSIKKFIEIKAGIKAQKRVQWPEISVAYRKSISALDAETLLQIHAIENSKAAIFLLVPLHKKETTDCYNSLIKHLLGKKKKNLETVTEYINSLISDGSENKFKNGILHELIINECWHETIELIEACTKHNIKIKEAITREDSDGRTPLEIALLMDTAPLEVLKQLTSLHQQAIVGAAKKAQANLVRIVSISYRQVNSDFLQWLNVEKQELYQGLDRYRKKYDVYSEEEYRALLRSVCVWGDRSKHADKNYLLLNVDGDDVCILREKSEQIKIGPKDTNSKNVPWVVTQEDKRVMTLSWLGAEQLPWEPLVCEGGAEVLALTEENMMLFFFLIAPDNGIWGEHLNFQVKVLNLIVNKLREYIGEDKFRSCMQMGAKLAETGKKPDLKHIRDININEQSILGRFTARKESLPKNNKKAGQMESDLHNKQRSSVEYKSTEYCGDLGLFGQSNHNGDQRMAAATKKNTLYWKAEDGQKMTIETGSYVELMNLKSRQDLNGTVAEVIKKIAGSDRYLLRIKNKSGQSQYAKVLPLNMKRPQECQNRAVPV